MSETGHFRPTLRASPTAVDTRVLSVLLPTVRTQGTEGRARPSVIVHVTRQLVELGPIRIFSAP
jgi:hypothetical protein